MVAPPSGPDDWEPQRYDRYAADRARPARDLLAAVQLEAPARIVDLGCGTGLSTALLAERWPGALCIGVDRSASMLSRARERLPQARFFEADIGSYRATPPPDLLFANASLHWLGDHEQLLPALVQQLRPGAVFAAQMPDNLGEPSHRLLRSIAASAPFADKLKSLRGTRREVADAAQYRHWLSPLTASLNIWSTRYEHRLDSAEAIADWFRSTAMKPYLDALPTPLADLFRASYLEALREAYPEQPEGGVVLLMPRLFMVAQRV